MAEDPQYGPGQQLAGTVYRVVRHLATGGMGSVYDVEDVTVGKRYVLKTLHPQLVNRQDLAKRMEAEARALAKLQHPNIVDVVTAGITTDEKRMPFYVMERLNGQNLRVVIEKKGSLELTHCYRIAIDVLDALEHAHENSVVHRDVKPDNIFLHRNVNGTTITKLLDFGIMRLLDQKASHTQGKFIGTLRYASPEQIFGGAIGPSTDIYSLGLVLYEMLCGRGPFDDLTDVYAIGSAHAQRPPPPLSRFAQVPRDLESLVMTALAKAPQDRPRDCFSFASALRRMLREEEAAPPRSATAIAVLSAVPGTRQEAALAGTEASYGPTEHASAPPVPLVADRASVPAPGRLDVQTGSLGDLPPNGVSLALASTLASSPPGVTPAPPAPPLIDRAAATRASAGLGGTLPLARSDTAVDAGPEAPASARHELHFPPTPLDAGGTGPLAGEARTRPPGVRSMMWPLLGASAVGAMMVGAAILFVTMKPGPGRAATPAAASVLPSTPAPTPSPPPASSPVVSAASPPSAALPPASAPAATAVPVAEAAPRPPVRGSGRTAPRGNSPANTPAAPENPAPPPSASASAPKKAPSHAPRPEDVGFD